jgi:hypothetical protein
MGSAAQNQWGGHIFAARKDRATITVLNWLKFV